MTPRVILQRSHVDIPTPDGQADAYLTVPDDGREHASVLLFMDAIGLRPRLEEMADRIAEHGYAVLVPNLFFRTGRAPVIPDLVERLQSEDRAEVFGELRPAMATVVPDVDTQAYVAFLDRTPAAATGPFATVGYCLGGALALRAAAQFPDRVEAAAAFHGGNLAPDDPAGPQHGAVHIRAEVYAGHADHDSSMPPEQIDRLEEALTEAGVVHRCEIYPDAPHGYTMKDMQTYDAVAEERHWEALLDLLARRLPVA